MKATEIMMGDWVYNTHNRQPEQVCEIREHMVMLWHTKHPDHDVECMLIGVDFEGEMFHLVPFDQDWYEDKDYWVHYKFVDKPRRKPKMKVVYGGEAEIVKSK